ncbi:MAG: hypothetical protein DYH12_03700 [Sorangiineae bacterium PRO1]|nr:hypothetical protein [Sorangiineae bacterium PRO1]
MLLASTYRAVGFHSHKESDVPAAGRAFDRASGRHARARAGRIGAEAWKTVLHGVLQSPKLQQQSAKRFLQLSPVVPDTALYSGSARLAGHPWNPGQLVAGIVGIGAADDQEASELWSELFEKLSVTEDDDVWARWLQLEFEARRNVAVDWQKGPLAETCHFAMDERSELEYPAAQFNRDLRAVLEAKELMTRRQWVSILESVLRLGAVSHVLWVCEAHTRLWGLMTEILTGGQVPDHSECLRRVFNGLGRPLVYGAPALPMMREMASHYLTARLGINLVLWQLEDAGVPTPSLGTGRAVVDLLRTVSAKRSALSAAGTTMHFHSLCDRHPRELSCKKGVGNNMIEFFRHALGQRMTADDTLRGYDQGYQLRKKAAYAAAPWIVSLGPVALLAFTHCCLLEAASPRSVTRLCEHLGRYGIDIDRDDIAEGEVGMQLRMLGLVLDSPDAESGMLLVPPFETPAGRQGAA